MTVSIHPSGSYTGVSYKASIETSIHNLLNSASCTLHAPLKSNLFLSRGTGAATWSRATAAWRFNELGYLEQIATGGAVFLGPRLVRNLVVKSETLLSGWTKNNGTETINSATNVTFASSSDGLIVTGLGAGAITAGAQVFVKARVWTDSGTYSIRFRAGGTYSSPISVTTTPTDYYASITCGSSSTYGVFASGSGGTINATNIQINDVTNYDASYVPEYVSVGVASSPYYGAGIDGAKYFETDWQGAPIAAANLLGFRREAAATNNLLHSRDLSNAAWSTKTNITAAKTATGLDGIANTATTLTADAADAIILQPITLASAARCASAYVKRRTGTGTISFTQDGGSTWTDITSQINSSTWTRVQITSTLTNPVVGFKITTSGDEIDVDCVQLESGAIATSPIVTTTATVTRNADSLTYPTASNIDFTVGSVFLETMHQGSTINSEVSFSVGTTAYLYRWSGIPVTSYRSYDGTNICTKNSISDITTGVRKRAASWGTSLKICGDGASPTSIAFDGSFGSGATIGIGADGSGGSPINGTVKNVAIFNYEFSDSELQGITS